MNGIGNTRETKRSAYPVESSDVWVKLLEQLGWSRYLDDDFRWKSKTNRYVDIDVGEEIYVDIFAWDGEGKAATYLLPEELSAFNLLILCLLQKRDSAL